MDAPTCRRCGDTYDLRAGCDPTPECDSCAHVALAGIREKLIGLRTRTGKIDLTDFPEGDWLIGMFGYFEDTYTMALILPSEY